jgi:integrase
MLEKPRVRLHSAIAHCPNCPDPTPRAVSEWFFINPDSGRHYSKDINRIWNAACDAAQVPRIRLYNAVRHSFVCQLLNSGVEKARVSRLLRHSDPCMIEKHAFYETAYKTASLEMDAGRVKRLANQVQKGQGDSS